MGPLKIFSLESCTQFLHAHVNRKKVEHFKGNYHIGKRFYL